MIDLDKFDLQILDALQADARITNPALGEIVHLSPSQVSRRVQRLEDAGLIERYATLLRAPAIGLGVTVYTRVSLERHSEAQTDAFNAAVDALPEVLECYSVTGSHDYLLKIVAADLASLSQFMMHRLMRTPGIRSVESSIVLQEIKRTTRLPLARAGDAALGAATPRASKRPARRDRR